MRSFLRTDCTSMDNKALGSLLRIEVIRKLYQFSSELQTIEIDPRVVWLTYSHFYSGPDTHWDFLTEVAEIALSLPRP